MERLMIDSDVIINWLAQEEESSSRQPLWVAPTIILELGEKGLTENYVSLLSLFEIRFVLRRKKHVNHNQIEQDIRSIRQIMRCNIPTDIELKQADQLQSENSLDPFDSILLSQALSLQAVLISRDKHFLNIARQYSSALTPEEYLEYST